MTIAVTNISPAGDHNIYGLRSIAEASPSPSVSVASRRSEGGYTLVALLAMMTVLALFAMAVAPSMQQQAQREREQEAIFRGEQVADAIRDYYRYRTGIVRAVGDQALPKSMDDLVQGIPIPGGSKNRQILRPSAARDPMTPEGEWRFVLPRSQTLIGFQQSLLFYTNNVVPQPHDNQMIQLQQFAVPALVNVTNLGSAATKPDTSSADDDASGPFVGVKSGSKRDSVLTYYGIERENEWIFTPLFR
jgi:type II secretory pathway pseudopilin PulG